MFSFRLFPGAPREKYALYMKRFQAASVLPDCMDHEIKAYTAFRHAHDTVQSYANSPSGKFICPLCMLEWEGTDFRDAYVFGRRIRTYTDPKQTIVMKGYCRKCVEQMEVYDKSLWKDLILPVEKNIEKAAVHIGNGALDHQIPFSLLELTDEIYIASLYVMFRALSASLTAAAGNELLLFTLRYLRTLLFPENPRKVNELEIAILKDSLLMAYDVVEHQFQGNFWIEPMFDNGSPRVTMSISYLSFSFFYPIDNTLLRMKNTIPHSNSCPIKLPSAMPKNRPHLLPPGEKYSEVVPRLKSVEVYQMRKFPPDVRLLFTGLKLHEDPVSFEPLKPKIESGKRTLPYQIAATYAPRDFLYHDKVNNKVTVSSAFSTPNLFFFNHNYALYSTTSKKHPSAILLVGGQVLYWFENERGDIKLKLTRETYEHFFPFRDGYHWIIFISHMSDFAWEMLRIMDLDTCPCCTRAVRQRDSGKLES